MKGVVQMNLRKSVLTTLLLAAIGIFMLGCGCSGGECPFKKMFGGSKSSESKPCCTTADANAVK
jgi:hypothetical protein